MRCRNATATRRWPSRQQPKLFISLFGQTGSLGGSSGSQVFLDAGSLAFQATQVVQLAGADLTTTLHFDRVDDGAVGLEHALDAVAVRDLAHGERGVQAGVLGGDDDAFVGLHALAAAFLHLHVDDNGVALAELRQFTGDLGGFEFRDDGLVQLAHGLHRFLFGWACHVDNVGSCSHRTVLHVCCGYCARRPGLAVIGHDSR